MPAAVLENTPSRKDGVSAKLEAELRVTEDCAAWTLSVFNPGAAVPNLDPRAGNVCVLPASAECHDVFRTL